MSYILSSSRPFDQPAHADIPQHPPLPPPASQNGRLPMPPASYPAYSSPSSSHHPASYSPDRPPISLPKVGQTRCYWALLNSELQFIYLDPVLASHLEDQAELLIGRSLLSFVHPDEQSSAKNDLGSVVESRTLHGSVTRVRFSRLSRVRRQLGYTGPLAQWSDADKIAVDANYMAVDIVINWAAEGLVLCFIHAIVDLTPNDNDEQNKTGWTNWCGTPLMDTPQIQLLYQRLLNSVPQPRIVDRVFQILANKEGRPLLISWPPDQGQRPIGSDFAQLVENAQIGNGMPDGNDAKTSCTRRYKALQTMPSLVGAQVESIFIPHGSVIFACHKVDTPSRSTASTTSTMQLGYSSASYSTQQPSPYYEQGTTYLPPLTAHSSYSANYPPPHAQPVPAGYAPQRWSQGEGSYSQWASSSPANAASPLPPAMSNLRSGSYPPPPPNPSWQTSSSSYVEAGNAVPPFNRSISPNYSYQPPGAGSEGASPSPDVVPPARRRISPGSSREQYSSGSSRSTGNRPTGILKCSSCKATTSPEWRKGPSGKKELCNACGLRYARSRAKKEGQNQPQRRRKDKGITKRDSATPPTSASPSFSAMRRGYVETSFVSTSSTGSNSGSEIYHPVHHLLDHSTPSPSPPSSSMSFVHYSPGSETRQSYSNPSGSFYSAPSPLSNTHVLHPQEQGPPAHPSQQQHQQQHRTNQLPPLGEISSYVDRLSPMHPSASPVPHSPLATLPPASFERERDRDRELPPAPLSVEPRHSRRSILTQQ